MSIIYTIESSIFNIICYQIQRGETFIYIWIEITLRPQYQLCGWCCSRAGWWCTMAGMTRIFPPDILSLSLSSPTLSLFRRFQPSARPHPPPTPKDSWNKLKMAGIALPRIYKWYLCTSHAYATTATKSLHTNSFVCANATPPTYCFFYFIFIPIDLFSKIIFLSKTFFLGNSIVKKIGRWWWSGGVFFLDFI